MNRGRHEGFTLIEIAVSLALVSLAVLTIFLVIPQGIHSQTMVRYKILASAKAQEMVDALRQYHPGMAHDARDQDKEGVFPWDTRTTYKSMAPDMEPLLESLRGTIKPLPEPIAYRLESENDEIRTLLDRGGRIYYFYPGLPVQGLDTSRTARPDQNWMDEARKLIVGIVGYPQQNSILYHPSVKVGPYQDFYPSPPSHGRWSVLHYDWYDGDFRQRSRRVDIDQVCYDALCRDPGIESVYRDPADSNRGFQAFASAVLRPDTAQMSSVQPNLARDYARKAFAYALTTGFTLGDSSDTDLAFGANLDDPAAFARANSAPAHWRRVLALRYLAHAGMILTSHNRGELTAGGVDIVGDGSLMVHLDHISAWHEAAIQAAVHHADRAGPYHWGAPRPLNRQVMMDHPLVQLDLWTPAISAAFPFQPSSTIHNRTYPLGYQSSQGTVFPPHVVGNQVIRSQWRACYPQPITEPGRPFMFPGRALDVGATGPTAATSDGLLNDDDLCVPAPSGWQAALGPASHFNLTAPFEPFERCRQMVFWAVDWQSYEDFESCPSARIDASRYPFPAPAPDHNNPFTDMMDWNQRYNQRTDYHRAINAIGGTSTLSSSSRNPELIYLFCTPSRAWQSGLTYFTDDGYFDHDIALMCEINVPMEHGNPSPFNYFNSDETRWKSVGVRCIDLRSEQGNDLAQNQADQILGHNTHWWNMKLFTGRYGANRDGRFDGEWRQWRGYFAHHRNQGASSSYKLSARVDRGNVPASLHLRATTVARFNFYDPRLSGALFH